MGVLGDPAIIREIHRRGTQRGGVAYLGGSLGVDTAGFVEHLAGAEYHWFQDVIAGISFEPPEDEDFVPYDPYAAFTSEPLLQ